MHCYLWSGLPGLARFIYHCQSHDESEYHKVCANKKPITSQPHTAEGPPVLWLFLEMTSLEPGDYPITEEANMSIVSNPIYSPNSSYIFIDTISPLLTNVYQIMAWQPNGLPQPMWRITSTCSNSSQFRVSSIYITSA